MKLSLSIGAVAMSTCTMLAASAPAWDHVVMSPQEVVAGDYGRSPSPCPAREGGGHHRGQGGGDSRGHRDLRDPGSHPSKCKLTLQVRLLGGGRPIGVT